MESKEVPDFKAISHLAIPLIISMCKIVKEDRIDNFYSMVFYKAISEKLRIEKIKAKIEILELVRGAMSDLAHIAVIDKKVFSLMQELEPPEEEIEWIDEDYQPDYVKSVVI